MPERIPQSAALRVPLKAYLSDGVTAATGKTIAIVISKNGAAFGNPSAGATNATEIANGWYYVDLSTTDTGTVGPLIVRGTATGVDDTEVAYDIAVILTAAQIWDLADAIETGLTPRQALRLSVSALAGVLSGAATNAVTIRNAVANSKARITATVDANGNRTVVNTDVT